MHHIRALCVISILFYKQPYLILTLNLTSKLVRIKWHCT